MSTIPLLHLVCQFYICSCELTTENNLPSILAWCKPLDSCGNSSVDEILLRCLIWIGENLDKRQQGMNASKSFNERVLFGIVDNLPAYFRLDRSGSRIFLCEESVFIFQQDECKSQQPIRTLLLKTVMSCFFVATRASMISLETSTDRISISNCIKFVGWHTSRATSYRNVDHCEILHLCRSKQILTR